MKKIISLLLFVIVFSVVLSPVLADEKNEKNEDSRGKNKIAQLERKPETEATKSADKKTRVRTALSARWNAYNRLVTVAGNLLDKLQIRIDKAKAAGKDTTAAVSAMTDARTKLADAKTKMDSLKLLLNKDLTKAEFKDAQKTLQAVHKDLNAIRLDAAKIISNLKSFNSSTKSAEIRATGSADKKD